MKNSFERFKNRILVEVLLKCFIVFLSIILIAVSVPLILNKVTELELNLLYFGLGGFGVAFIVFLLMYFKMKPNKMRIAKRLDNTFALDEKVQTMVEFEKEDGLLVNIQREDTLEILERIPVKKLSIKISIFLFIFLFLATCTCVTAVALPKEDDSIIDDGNDGFDDPDYEADDWTKKALIDLIDYVEKSDFNEKLKSKYVLKLKELLSELETIDKLSEMHNSVKNVIDYVNLEIDLVNTNKDIFTVLRNVENYYINTFAVQIYLLNVEKLRASIGGFVTYINGVGDAITELDPSFGKVLKDSNIDKNDKLYQSIIKFADDLNNCYGAENVNNAVIEVVDKNVELIIANVLDQKANKDIADYIIEQLKHIFGLDDYIDDSDEDIEGSLPSDDEDKPIPLPDGGQGGLGTGDLILGSDDVIFDPEEGSIKYSEVIDKYYGDIVGDFKDGKISEDLKNFFNSYFELLFGNSTNNNDENN